MEKHVMEFGSADQLCGFQSTQLVNFIFVEQDIWDSNSAYTKNQLVF